MGCSCSGTNTSEKRDRVNGVANPNHNPSVNNQGLAQHAQHAHPVNPGNPNALANARPNNANANRPNYIPYLQSRNDPSFNMPELKDLFCGSGLKRMPAYVCHIEKDDLARKRLDFWTSRFEGSAETWELLHHLCEWNVGDEDLVQLLEASGLTTYSGCLNVLYDAKGNLYEIPNYCIHEPSKWEIQKFSMPKPKETEVSFVVRCGNEDLRIETSNFCPVDELKSHISQNFEFARCGVVGEVGSERIRLFHSGKEMKNGDLLYMHYVQDAAIVLLMVRPLE